MNCDRIARWYRWLEYISCGRALERRRFEYSAQAAVASQQALLLGDGDGRFLEGFLASDSDCKIDSVEVSREMLRLARARVARLGAAQAQRVTFTQADARECALSPGKYDLVVTHFFLDCFSSEECGLLIARIAKAARPRASWVVSEFHQPAFGFARYWTGLFIRVCYFFFRLTTGLETSRLPEYRSALASAGFQRVQSRMAGRGLLISELWQRSA